ncbi:hypothetical protein [Kocuria turfanensis]|uniref:DUF5667 domain-containing protein n=1 Tax=Kocuria turfanensis TaxID=388357 RepID=A0A512IH52_9MICC|nr:hypothetical protein [Kocuria turfanensis]GEO97033.1 hypothetical protein KTU01_31560 [Kocuria turfanensis]
MATMNTTVKRWMATGSSATLLVGGLVLGAPAAVAAPDDAACLRASGQFTSALAGAGITAVSVSQLEQAAEAVVVAEEQFFALTDAAAGELEVQLEAAWVELEAAETAEDPEAIAAAEARIADLETAIEAALDTPEILAAEQALFDATDALDVQLSMLTLDEATAERILALFQQFLAACDAAGTGTPITTPVAVPAPVAPAAPVPVVTAPTPAPVAAPVPAAVPVAPVVTAPEQAAPMGMNPGLNMQTAATAHHEHPGAALVAGLLAAGIAVPAAVAVRMLRLQRHRP